MEETAVNYVVLDLLENDPQELWKITKPISSTNYLHIRRELGLPFLRFGQGTEDLLAPLEFYRDATGGYYFELDMKKFFRERYLSFSEYNMSMEVSAFSKLLRRFGTDFIRFLQGKDIPFYKKWYVKRLVTQLMT